MNHSLKDWGTLQALLDRLLTQRLPRLLRLNAALEQGAKLSAGEVDFLYEVLKSAGQIKPLVDRNPAFQDMYASMVGFLLAMTALSLENEWR